jgi:hypothetical protein
MEAEFMNKKIILLVLVFCFVLGFNSIAAARIIDFGNRTSYHWVGLYINYDGEGRDWGENLLSYVVNNGEYVTIDVHRTNSEYFKIKIVERHNGQYYKHVWSDVNLSGASRVILYYDPDSERATFKIIRN